MIRSTRQLSKKIILFVFILTSFSFTIYADQVFLLDSLQQLPDDTIKVNAIYKKGYELRAHNSDLAMQLANLCEKTAKKCNSPKHMAKAYNLLGILYYRTGNYQQAIHYHTKALEIREQLNDTEGIGISKLNLANIFMDLKNYARAERYYLDANRLFTACKNNKQLTNTFINLGNLKFEQKNYQLALYYFTKAKTLAEQLENHELNAICCNNIGSIKEFQGKLDEAVVFLKEAASHNAKLENEIDEADVFLNLGNVFVKQKNYDAALTHYGAAQKLYIQNHSPEGIRSYYQCMASCYRSMQKYDSAYFYQDLFIHINDSIVIQGNYNQDSISEKIIEKEVTKNQKLSLEKQKLVLYFIITMLVITVFGLLFLIIRIRLKNEQKK